MTATPANFVRTGGLSRRRFLGLAALSAAGLAAGCAVNPVTGEQQLMLVTEETEISLDKKNSPHQFSADYGPVADTALNQYVNQVGTRMAGVTHRPQMPYSFRVVNATYINAYAFPGGSIAATRGILLKLDNEAELAALMGHELGHVNARHTAQQMSKGMLTQALVAGVAIYAGTKNAVYGELAATLGMLGAGALLASYSRDNERQADALGMEYMVKSGYGTPGMEGLMGVLKDLSKHKPNTVELLFATHPMSDERYETAVNTARTRYAAAENKPIFKERYMDHTAGLRRKEGAIKEMQAGEAEMNQKNYPNAEGHFQTALKALPEDYAGLLMMAKCQIALKRPQQAEHFTSLAKQAYPNEAQARHVSGFVHLQTKAFDAALADFNDYERLLPGNPNTMFFQGAALEAMGKIPASAARYRAYLQQVNQGSMAQYSYQRLVKWGYAK